MLDMKYFLLSFLLLTPILSAQYVCIHGLMGVPANLGYIQNALIDNGLDAISYGYSSKEKTLQEHGHDLALFLKKMATNHPNKPIFFVTHSMGAIVLRAAINDPDCPEEAKKGGVVQIAPPNQGCVLGRKYYNYRIVSWQLGDKAGKEVAIERCGFKHLGDFPPSMRILIIAGRYKWKHVEFRHPFNVRYNPLIKGDNDGLIRVKETYLETPHDHVIVEKGGHDSILQNEETIDHILTFFKNIMS